MVKCLQGREELTKNLPKVEDKDAFLSHICIVFTYRKHLDAGEACLTPQKTSFCGFKSNANAQARPCFDYITK